MTQIKWFIFFILISTSFFIFGQRNNTYLITGCSWGNIGNLKKVHESHEVYLSIQSDTFTKVRLTNHTNYDTAFNLDSVTHIKIPYALVTQFYKHAETIDNSALLLYSNQSCNIVITHYYGDTQSSTSSRILAKNDCGTLYYPLQPLNPMDQDTAGKFIKIAAFENNTRIKILSTFTSARGTIISGVPKIITLNLGQTYTFYSNTYISNNKQYPLYYKGQTQSINGTRIESLDSCKKIAVFTGETKVQYFKLYLNTFCSAGILHSTYFEQCVEADKWAGEYVFIPNNINTTFNPPYYYCRAETNWFLIYTSVDNTVWINTKKINLKANTFLFDTLSVLTLIKGNKPFGAIHLVWTWGGSVGYNNYSQNEAARDHGFVNEFTNANILKFEKEICWLKPPMSGIARSNSLVLLSYKSDSIYVNSKWITLKNRSGNYFYDTVYLQNNYSKIKCKIGCTGYFMFDRASVSQGIKGSGVTSLGPIGTSFTQKISINDSPVGWFEVNDTASVKVCRNTKTKLEVNTGIYKLFKARWYLDGTLIDSGGIINQKFKDTGWHWIKVTATRNQRQCNDSTTTETTNRRIYVYPEITYRLPKDTLMCAGNILYLNPKDSTVYYDFNYSGYPLSCNYCRDQKIIPSKNTSLSVYMYKEGCPMIDDTMKIDVRDSLKLLANSPSSLCNGQLFNPYYTATGGDSMHYKFSFISEGKTLSVPFAVTKSFDFKVVVNDGCSVPGDTSEEITQTVTPALILAESKTIDMCYGKVIYLPQTTTGGLDKNIKISWKMNGRILSDTLIPTSSGLAIGIASDGCSTSDTAYWKINVNPSPKADFTYDLACSRTITKFQFTGTKPQTPITTLLKWDFNNEAISTLENPTHKFAAAGTKTTLLILTSDNGCADTLIKTIDIKPQAKADFTVSDVCESDSAVFINKSEDATGYNWKFGDGQTSKIPSAIGETKHKFQISSSTTFNVTLVALVTNGCSDSIVKAVTINENPKADFTSTQIGNKLDLKANAGYTKYQWNIETTDSFTSITPNYLYTLKNYTTHKVCLKVIDGIGCTAQTCKTITLGITKFIKPGGFKIYPNPNSGSFTIDIENPEKDGSIMVYDFLGRLIKTVATTSSKTSYSINLVSNEKLGQAVANGIYLVRVNNGGIIWNQKVLVSADGR